jgi:hypothetical protein
MAQAHSDTYGVKACSLFMDSPKALAGLGMGSGFLMSATFIWLNTRMGLSNASPAMNWVRPSSLSHLETETDILT